MTNNSKVILLLLGTLLSIPSAKADSSDARCEIYSSDTTTLIKQVACTFSQRQGNISLRLDNEVIYHLTPVPDALGTFTDQNQQSVYRQSGLGKQGLIFLFPNKRIFVYWEIGELDQPQNNH